MSQVIIECVQCGSNEYILTNECTGEVMCPYCRAQWVVPALAQKLKEEKPEKGFIKRVAEPYVALDKASPEELEQMELDSGFKQKAVRKTTPEKPKRPLNRFLVVAIVVAVFFVSVF